MLRKALITCGLISITIGCGGKKSSETSEVNGVKTIPTEEAEKLLNDLPEYELQQFVTAQDSSDIKMASGSMGNSGDFNTLTIDDFNTFKKKMKWTFLNNSPVGNFYIKNISCSYEYLDDFYYSDGEGRTSSNLNIYVNDAYTILSDRAQCVNIVFCDITMGVVDSSATRRLSQNLNLVQRRMGRACINTINSRVFSR